MRDNIENDMKQLMETLAPDMEQVNEIILRQLKSHSPLTEKIARHLITSGGKRLRPVVMLASAHLGGLQDIKKAHKMAAAIEIMHTATLLHDDVVDESDKRRNQPTAQILWGNAAAILVGDFLLGRSFELMVEVESLEALKILSQAASIISEGEVMQLDLKGAINIQESEMMKVIAAKTASLFASATETGAILSGLVPAKREALRAFGFNVGMGFQLMDDALDYHNTSQHYGKPTGTDFFEGKITLPLILCYRKSTGAERSFLTERIENPESIKPADLKKVCNLMKKYDALAATREHAIHYIEQAKTLLDVFAQNANETQKMWLNRFSVIADFCIVREF